VLIAFNDNLSSDALYGPDGIIRKSHEDTYVLVVPHLPSNLVITFEGMSVLHAPVWTEKGQELGLDPMTFNMLPDARKLVIAKPGFIAEGHLLTDRFTEETSGRIARFNTLAIDAAECIDRLHFVVNLPILREYKTIYRLDPESQWLKNVHKLSWRKEKDPDSLLRSKRNTWVVGEKGHTSFLPYEEDDIRKVVDAPFFAKIRHKITIPPDRWVSVLKHEVFTSSAHAIDDLLYMADAAKFIETDDMVATSSITNRVDLRRNQVFISYCHEDEKWFREITTMLAPAIKNSTISIWHDKKIKPGAQWRKEIEGALNSAKLSLLLVTKNFLASEFINETELSYLFEAAANKAVNILWVAVGHCMYEHTSLEDIQCLNDPAKPLDSFHGSNKEAQIKKICQQVVEAYQ
jgi:hypothetical protein